VAVSVAGTFATVIALVTAVFAVINAVWLNALPFAEPRSVVVIGRTSVTAPSPSPGPISEPEFLDWTERSREFDGLAAVSAGYGLMTADFPDGARSIDIATVTPNLFRLFGVHARLGRVFDDGDVAAGRSDLIVLGHTFWEQVFHSDPSVIGKRIRLAWFDDSKVYEVTGVVPGDFQVKFPKAHDAYIAAPVFGHAHSGPARRGYTHTVFARLQPYRSIATARAAMRQLGETLRREYPTTPQNTTVEVMPVDEYFFGRTRPLLVALAGAAAFILLLACANVSSILLSATLDRSAELATRAALGANRWRLTAMLIAEHAVLGVVGSLAGLVLASTSLGVLRRAAPAELPRVETIAIDWRVVVVSVGIAAVATLTSALFAAWRFGRINPADELRSGGRSLDAGTRRAQLVLLTTQIALVVALLLGAGVMAGSLQQLLKVDLGFEPNGLIGLRARFLRQNYGPAGAVLQDRLKRQVLGRADVVSAGWTSEVPLGTPNTVALRLRSGGNISPRYRIISSGYLETVGASLLRGRLLDDRDRDGDPVAVVNRSFVERYFPDREALGEEVFIREWHRIVGVVNNLREGPLEDPDTPTIYWPFSGRNWMAGAPWLIVRVRDARRANPEMLRAVVASVDPTLPVAAVERMIDRVSQHTARTRFLTTVLSGIAMVALLIAAGGIFGMTSYSVRRRRQEFGLRMALGADHRAIAWQVLRGIIALATVGIAAGLALGWMVNRTIRTLMFGVGPNDPVVTMTSVALLALVLVMSCLVPLRRALAIEPAEALRRD
jgi:predicted permease